jgi:hypothetical protein
MPEKPDNRRELTLSERERCSRVGDGDGRLERQRAVVVDGLPGSAAGFVE